MDGCPLAINLYDEETRARIESLQWKLGQQLLKLGLVVIIEWGTWGKSERDALREGALILAPLSNCITCPRLLKFFLSAFNAEAWKIRQ